MIAMELSENFVRFGPGEDNRTFGRAFDAFDSVKKRKFTVEDLLVKKEQGAKGLVLGGSRDVTVDSKVTEESTDFVFAHLAGVTFIVKQDKTARPIDVSLLSPDRIVFGPQ
jgi:hypothetical protein